MEKMYFVTVSDNKSNRMGEHLAHYVRDMYNHAAVTANEIQAVKADIETLPPHHRATRHREWRGGRLLELQIHKTPYNGRGGRAAMQVGDRVIVDAAVTGDGVHHSGVIEDIYDFTRTSFVDVHFDEPTPWGTWGATITNLGLIRKEAAV